METDFLGIDWRIDPDTRDWVLDAVGEPGTVSGRACLAQDLRRAVLSDAEVLGFLQRDLQPGEARDFRNLVALIAERDPRVVKRSARVTLLRADKAGLEVSLSVQPIGADRRENVIVRMGGWNG